MALSDYILRDDQGKAQQFSQFSTNLPAQLTILGLAPTDPDIVQQALDAIRFRALVDFGVVMQSSAQAWTASKNHERDGGDTTPSGQTVPVLAYAAQYSEPAPNFQHCECRMRGASL